MSARIDLGAVEEFEEGVLQVRQASSRQIGVARWKDRFYALRNICPHQSAPLCAGRLLTGISDGEPVGVIEADDGAPVVTCPWHGWEFHLDTGKSLWDERYKVRAYQVVVENGRVLLEMGR
ncbi:Rieske (2Fe-2S) protein [Amycolatopsis echigonensis]|uniref:Nitrite reductase (NAD(P)H) small subunit n=1 Tax=Amycolatopsis echigonensis TaxID=2576905 RepID=A0A8E2B7U1_9PSEU|nr:nitrite reductase (NAD(P)H) small subunit [Amycolatopsis echigonensis]MBB2505139.1 nitrite reductase (NAD(P)H) small subunit [Amycolatopsis echigonensis]